MAEQKRSLALKLVTILENLSSVPKKGYNANQKYHYTREVDVLEALKEQLVKEKIILLTSSKFVDITEKNQDGKLSYITTVETTHTFVDADSTEQYVITSVGSGHDSLDKGASKAITAAVKYALTKTFMISDEGADIENDGVTAQPPVSKPATTFTPPVTKAAAPTEPAGMKVTTPQQNAFQSFGAKVAPASPPKEVKPEAPAKAAPKFGTKKQVEPSFP